MSDIVSIAAPLSEVRDVVETFRRHHIVEPDWAGVLASAAHVLEGLRGHQIENHVLSTVVDELRTLVAEGLPGNDELVARVAEETQVILRVATPAGIPTPDDDDWAFPGPTSS